MEISWADGYVTARNSAVAEQLSTYFKGNVTDTMSVDFDLLKGTDVAAMEAWLENYCQAHPLDQLIKAMSSFTGELLERTPAAAKVKSNDGTPAGAR